MSEDGGATEVYGALREEILLRMAQQNKCMELSIPLGAGSGAAAAALFGSDWFTKQLPAPSPHFYSFVASTMVLHSLLQEAIWATYAYQS